MLVLDRQVANLLVRAEAAHSVLRLSLFNARRRNLDWCFVWHGVLGTV